MDAFCTALLRENTHLLPKGDERHALTPDFRVLDEGDAALVRQRVLERTLEAFYDALDEAGAALADTLGAGRDDRALEALVLEIHEKLQSHAYPEQWLEKNQAAWSTLDGSFDDTPYAAALLTDGPAAGSPLGGAAAAERRRNSGGRGVGAGLRRKIPVQRGDV